MHNTVFITDPNRAAFYICKGARFVNAETAGDGRRLRFVFDNTDGRVEELASSFIRNESVGISDFLTALKNVKELIWSHKVSGGDQ